jgi:uncharacterized protein (DUF2235 family)
VRTLPRNIVVCCDGTDNEVARDSTNVLRLYRMLARDRRQVAYYDPGVGTLVNPFAITRRWKYFARRIDAAIGYRVRDNVVAAYLFLAGNYLPGDSIYLFGFSRGAYTVRALAGMIQFLGLVRPELQNLGGLARALYCNEDQGYGVSERFGGGNRFNAAFGVVPKPMVHFVGVFDTVSSFGWVWDFQTLPFTADNPSVRHIRHALAIDERRACFPANLFVPGEQQRADCKQVWFAGVHADVGGGYPEKEAMLAKVPLTWMLREAEALGLLIDDEERERLMGSKKKPAADYCSPIHESLTGLFWKCMEFLPRRNWNNDAKGMRWHAPNLGRRREIKPDSVIHVSVVERMRQMGYAPANLPKDYRVEE